jgi:hypothetical protein
LVSDGDDQFLVITIKNQLKQPVIPDSKPTIPTFGAKMRAVVADHHRRF